MALHARDDVDGLYVLRKERERRLASIQDSVDTSIRRLEDYTKKNNGRLITTTKNNTNNTSINKTKITRKQKWDEKKNSVDISSNKQARPHKKRLEKKGKS